MGYNSQIRINKYKIMWIFIAFDLPTETKKERRSASLFRTFLLKDGFNMFQFSIYVRHCASRENMQVHINRIKKNLPPAGKVSILHFTDAQFSKAINFIGRRPKKQEKAPTQLSFF